jgi:hypothetical protein
MWVLLHKKPAHEKFRQNTEFAKVKSRGSRCYLRSLEGYELRASGRRPLGPQQSWSLYAVKFLGALSWAFH